MKKTLLFLFLGAVLAVINVQVVSAQWTVESVPNTKLNDARVYVSDPDDLIDAASESEINNVLGQAEAQSSAEVFVVALKSVGEIYIKDFATSLFNQWGIGKKSKDNGMLILMVEDQAKVSFETGYGMEGVFPDAICMRIISNDIVPFMKDGNYGKGLLSGVNAVKKIIDDPAVSAEIAQDIEAEMAVEREREAAIIKNLVLAYLGLSVLVLILAVIGAGKSGGNALAKTNPYEAYKKMNTSLSGYYVLAVLFPLTMILFLLWYKAKLRRLRNVPRICAECNKPMQKMKENQEDVYLTSGQQSEELVGSVDYDAWVCMDCGRKEIYSYSKGFTRYQPCPKCGYKTYVQTHDRILNAPTTFSTGQGERVYNCSHCGHVLRKSYIIPMIILAAAAAGKGKGGFGGGFGGGGGGFGGGGFGGGMSGGGGATGGWR